jgi:outer membrane factor, OMF family
VSHSATRLALLSALGLPLLSPALAAQEMAPAVEAPAPADATAPAAGLPPLPLAPDVKGERPQLNPKLVAPAATELLPSVQDLPAPDSLALPTRPEQVTIRELRPLTLGQVENLAELNNPNLKAIASQVDQAQSNLRAQISQWYPNLNLNANTLPAYNYGETRNRLTQGGSTRLSTDRWSAGVAITAQWALINPQRTPTIAAARDQFERAKFQYVISLRDLRLQAAQAYFDLQQADDQVRIGKESVRASLVSLRDSRARFQAGVATKLEVLEAETQLARDQQLLTNALASQSVARRALASLLDLPQSVTPTAQDPSRVLGVWQPSLQESIVAAYAFREELDQVLLDISIANSQANAALGQVQPFLNIFAGFDAGWFDGNQPGVGNPISIRVPTTTLRWGSTSAGTCLMVAPPPPRLARTGSLPRKTPSALPNGAIRCALKWRTASMSWRRTTATSPPRPVRSSRPGSRCVWLDCVSRRGSPPNGKWWTTNATSPTPRCVTPTPLPTTTSAWLNCAAAPVSTRLPPAPSRACPL